MGLPGTPAWLHACLLVGHAWRCMLQHMQPGCCLPVCLPARLPSRLLASSVPAEAARFKPPIQLELACLPAPPALKGGMPGILSRPDVLPSTREEEAAEEVRVAQTPGAHRVARVTALAAAPPAGSACCRAPAALTLRPPGLRHPQSMHPPCPLYTSQRVLPD